MIPMISIYKYPCPMVNNRASHVSFLSPLLISRDTTSPYGQASKLPSPYHSMNLRYMRASPAFSLEKLQNSLSTRNVTKNTNVTKKTEERWETLSLIDDDGESLPPLVDDDGESSFSSSSPQACHPIPRMPNPPLGSERPFLKRYGYERCSTGSSSSSSQLVCHRIPGMVQPPFFLPRIAIGILMSCVRRYMENPPLIDRKNIADLSYSSLFKIPRGLPACIDAYELPKKVFMGLLYRFKPGQTQFIIDDMLIPTSLNRLKLLRDTLGISISKNSASIRDLCTFTHQDGIRSAIDAKNRIEVVTLLHGTFYRIVILTSTGLCCYGFYPCTDGIIPTDFFGPIVSYDPFNNVETIVPNYRSAIISVNDNVSETIKDAFTSVPPLDEVKEISGNVLHNVGLGIIIAVLITTGVLTITPDPVDIQQVLENL